jgi:hypothetical protein
MENNSNNAAKYAFFYMLSLVALIFTALSSGMIIFQIINKTITDVISNYSGNYSIETLKFGISALIIAAPIFFFTMSRIYKSLYEGLLAKESEIRKWLTYLVLFVSSVVMIGWLIGTINSFLDGDLTLKFILKSITAIGISASIFTFFLYDIKRENVKGNKDNVVRAYFYGSLVFVIAVFIASLFFVESPSATRDRKIDQQIINNFSSLDYAINDYYNEFEKMPVSLLELKEESGHILRDEDIRDPESKELFEYKITGQTSFELCANFRTSNKDENDARYRYMPENNLHDSGYQCLERKIKSDINGPEKGLMY